VLERDLSYGELNLNAGDFHVAAPSSTHPPGRTVNGCLVHLIMSLDRALKRDGIRLNRFGIPKSACF